MINRGNKKQDVIPQEIKQHDKSSARKRKKWSKKKKGIFAIGVTVGALIAYIFRKSIQMFFVIMFLLIGVSTSKVEVYNDIDHYKEYMNKVDCDEYVDTSQTTDYGNQGKLDKKYEKFNHCDVNMTIFPDEITTNMKVKEFQTVYYNPWDEQFVSYLTVEYTKDDYEQEKQRLNAIGIDKYSGINNNYGNNISYYSVTGEPDNYNLAALKASSYHGFIYAIIPEKEDNTITYVEIIFCNYFLDLDIHKYLPNGYLLKGFDASSGNPYEKMIKGK